MSTFFNCKIKCSLCGKESSQAVLGSTNAIGSPDLDLRPPMMKRSTMNLWLQECPCCGNIAPSLESPAVVSIEWLKNDSFINCDNLGFYSSLAERFYKYYLINVEVKENKAAFLAALHAAWVCDDFYDGQNAIVCRKKALVELEKIPDLEKTNEDWYVIRADLLRRTGQFDQLIEEYTNKKFSKQIMNDVIAFQIYLAKKGNVDCYKTSDIKEGPSAVGRGEFENKCLELIKKIVSLDVKQDRKGAVAVAGKKLQNAEKSGKKLEIAICAYVVREFQLATDEEYDLLKKQIFS